MNKAIEVLNHLVTALDDEARVQRDFRDDVVADTLEAVSKCIVSVLENTEDEE